VEKYFFVGVVSHAGGLEYNAVGQRADFTDEYFRDVIVGGASFLPENDFNEIFSDFSTELLLTYGDPYFFGTPSQDYLDRVEKCRERVRQIREQFQA
jgi:hypothetical protein